MVPLLRRLQPRGRRLVIALLAVAGLATAAVVEFAIAKAFTLEIAKGARVVNTKGTAVNESIVVSSHAQAVYYLTGDSQRHPKCTSVCQTIWRPVSTASSRPAAGPGVRGMLRIWHRGSAAQLTLAGRPLYTFINDHQKRMATGEGIASFGGTWHVIADSSRSASPPPTTSTTTSTTSTTNPYGY